MKTIFRKRNIWSLKTFSNDTVNIQQVVHRCDFVRILRAEGAELFSQRFGDDDDFLAYAVRNVVMINTAHSTVMIIHEILFRPHTAHADFADDVTINNGSIKRLRLHEIANIANV